MVRSQLTHIPELLADRHTDRIGVCVCRRRYGQPKGGIIATSVHPLPPEPSGALDRGIPAAGDQDGATVLALHSDGLVRSPRPEQTGDLRLTLRLLSHGHEDLRHHARAERLPMLGKAAADALFAAEVPTFPGRLGIMHRDLPEMVARGYADVAFTWRHLVSYWARVFPDHSNSLPFRTPSGSSHRSPWGVSPTRSVHVPPWPSMISSSAAHERCILDMILRA